MKILALGWAHGALFGGFRLGKNSGTKLVLTCHSKLCDVKTSSRGLRKSSSCCLPAVGSSFRMTRHGEEELFLWFTHLPPSIWVSKSRDRCISSCRNCVALLNLLHCDCPVGWELITSPCVSPFGLPLARPPSGPSNITKMKASMFLLASAEQAEPQVQLAGRTGASGW